MLHDVVPGPDAVAVDRRDAVAELERAESGRPGGESGGRHGVDLGHREPGSPEHRRDPGVDDEREHDVDRDAGEDHDHALPGGLAVERAGRVDGDVGLAALQIPRDSLILEPRHLHVAAERKPRDPVLGLAAPPAEHRPAEPEREPQHLNPHGLGRDEVPHLVHEDEDAEHHGHGGERQEHATSRARRRASASAASTAASDPASLAWCASSTRAMVSAIRPNRIFPSRNRVTATSFAALKAVGAVPPTRAAARPSPYAGYSSAATGSKVSVPAATGSKRRTPASGTRSGWGRAYRIGSSIVGKPT